MTHLTEPTLQSVIRGVYNPVFADTFGGRTDVEVFQHPGRRELHAVVWTTYRDGAVYSQLPLDQTVMLRARYDPHAVAAYLDGLMRDLLVLHHFNLVSQRGGFY